MTFDDDDDDDDEDGANDDWNCYGHFCAHGRLSAPSDLQIG